MPIVRIQVPAGAYPEAARESLLAELNELVAATEQMPPDPEKRLGLILLWEELPPGAIRSNGSDPTPVAIPAFLWFHPPAGVVDDAHAATFVAAAQALFERHAPADGRQVVTSVAFLPVQEGHWGIGGRINRLPDFAARAGYAHLQHLVA